MKCRCLPAGPAAVQAVAQVSADERRRAAVRQLSPPPVFKALWLPAAVNHLGHSQRIFFLKFSWQEVLGETLVRDGAQEPVDG